MKFFALVLVGFTMLSPLARASDGNSECPYNGAKFVPYFKNLMRASLEQDLDFAWNESSLNVACGRNTNPEAYAPYVCTVSFTAKDGTHFFVRDTQRVDYDADGNRLPNYYSAKGVSIIEITNSQETDKEGNPLGPKICSAELYDFDVVNAKSGVAVNSSSATPDLHYTQ